MKNTEHPLVFDMQTLCLRASKVERMLFSSQSFPTNKNYLYTVAAETAQVLKLKQ